MTATKLTRESVTSDIHDMSLAIPAAAGNLYSDHAYPMVASKGAGSVHVLRRRRGKGWQYIGYAVWSWAEQAWVCGSWSRPVEAAEAHAYLVGMAWEG